MRGKGSLTTETVLRAHALVPRPNHGHCGTADPEELRLYQPVPTSYDISPYVWSHVYGAGVSTEPVPTVPSFLTVPNRARDSNLKGFDDEE